MLNNIAAITNSGALPAVGDYESIATVSPSGSSTVDFTSISSTYKHLQIRYATKGTSNGTGMRFRANSDTASNYYIHYLYGDGSAPGALAQGPATSGVVGEVTSTANVQSVGVIDILDYTSTNKNKTVRSFFGYDNNGSGTVYLNSVLWSATPAAINSISIFTSAGTLTGTFSLYGIK
jgi:hypothetical protein